MGQPGSVLPAGSALPYVKRGMVVQFQGGESCPFLVAHIDKSVTLWAQNAKQPLIIVEPGYLERHCVLAAPFDPGLPYTGTWGLGGGAEVERAS